MAGLAGDFPSSATFSGCGFLHNMKFRAPCDPIVSHGLKATGKFPNNMRNKIPDLFFYNMIDQGIIMIEDRDPNTKPMNEIEKQNPRTEIPITILRNEIEIEITNS